MRFKLLVLLAVLSAFFTSCKYNDVFINPYDPNADMSEIQKICGQENAECGYVSVKYRNSTIELFCGECATAYECKYNTCFDINECENPSLNNCPVHSDCHNLDMESDGQPYECICKDNYSGNDCVPDTREKECTDLPDNAEWNSVSSISQTWNGTEWQPSNKATFNNASSISECRFKCISNYSWTGSACKADTRTANCTGLPANAEWDSVSSITQTWNGEEWAPSSKGTYNESKSSKECRFKCKDNFEWNGSECVGKTQTINCTGLPENAVWNTVSEIEQTFNGSTWVPTSYGEYNEEASETECRFICGKNYEWDGKECVAATKEVKCAGLPANASWNSVSSITQTWNGSEWIPPATESYNEESSTVECRFICNEFFNWNSSAKKCDAATQEIPCTGLPENALWNTVSNITQSWSGTEWLPTTTGSFSETASTVQCVFKCKTNYNWNDSTNKCDAATQEADCSSKPENTVWNDGGANGKFTQTWDGSSWNPASYTSSYNTSEGTCRYKCDSSHTWENSSCINQRTADCSAKPANSVWNDNGANGIFMQTWNGSAWIPASYDSSYSTTAGICTFTCDTNYNWNNSKKTCDAATQEADCSAKPENTVWNDGGANGKFTQTWDGSSWNPASYTSSYNASEGTCRYKCESDYHRENSQCVSNSKTDVACTGKPANASWNTVSIIDQTWNGSSWTPSSTAFFNLEASALECRFKCDENYGWNGSECAPGTQNDNCSPKPEHAVWNDSGRNGTFTQTWSGTSWNPASYTSEYSETAGVCIFKCDDTHYWYDSECTSPCDYEPCEEVANSTHVCEATSWNDYTCGCDDGYFWNGSECKKQISLGNICTGQNRCYNNTEEIICPTSKTADFYGQDAQYAKAGYCYPQSFTVKTVSGQNIVVDNNTGLEWQQVISEDTFTWDDALSHCENLEYAGYNDWRLPTPQELRSLIDQGKENPSIDGVYFPDTPNDRFWSSLITASDATLAWELRFAGGGIGVGGVGSSTSTKYYARCVRGKTLPESSFVSSKINSEDVVTDTSTGLMWQGIYEGTEEEGRTWQQALSYCENLTYAGYSDWRLPNVNELASLINYDKYEPASDFPEMPSFEVHSCSSTTYTSIDIKKTIDVKFSNGHIGYGPSAGKSGAIKVVRCVRSERINDPCENNDACENMANSTEVCVPENAFEYSCECIEGHFWDGENCVDPCSTNPCSDVANSNKTCTALSWKEYSCGCNSGYFWNGNICEKRGLSLGKICTGQTTCYNNSSSITCPSSPSADFYGQDAQYRSKCTAQSFTVKTVSNQKVVVDNNTLLEWQQTLSTSNYTWDKAVSYCNNLTYAGYTDWRLPSPQELLSIVSNSKTGAAVNSTYFPNMPTSNESDSYMWTSKEQTSTTAFDFRPYYGFVYYNNSKTGNRRVMCVRGSELPKGSFNQSTTSGKVVVTDSTTALMWQKEAVSGKTWQQALKYCEDSTYAGYSDWRLPNKNELSSLLNYDITLKPYSDFPSLPSSWFWASSTLQNSASKAWYVGFENGYHGLNGTKSRETYVLCVRN